MGLALPNLDISPGDKMKKIALILILLCSELGIGIVFAQSSYDVKKVCYGSGTSAMVVEHDQRYYVVASNSNVTFTKNMLISDIPFIDMGGQSSIRFTRSGGSRMLSYVNVIAPGQLLFFNNRWQRFMYSGLPGARSVCRQIAYGY